MELFHLDLPVAARREAQRLECHRLLERMAPQVAELRIEVRHVERHSLKVTEFPAVVGHLYLRDTR